MLARLPSLADADSGDFFIDPSDAAADALSLLSSCATPEKLRAFALASFDHESEFRGASCKFPNKGGAVPRDCGGVHVAAAALFTTTCDKEAISLLRKRLKDWAGAYDADVDARRVAASCPISRCEGEDVLFRDLLAAKATHWDVDLLADRCGLDPGFAERFRAAIAPDTGEPAPDAQVSSRGLAARRHLLPGLRLVAD